MRFTTAVIPFCLRSTNNKSIPATQASFKHINSAWQELPHCPARNTQHSPASQAPMTHLPFTQDAAALSKVHASPQPAQLVTVPSCVSQPVVASPSQSA